MSNAIENFDRNVQSISDGIDRRDAEIARLKVENGKLRDAIKALCLVSHAMWVAECGCLTGFYTKFDKAWGEADALAEGK